MDFTQCPLFQLKSKKQLMILLGLDRNFLKQDYVASQVSAYIKKDGKERLIEPPSNELKKIQTKMKKMLGKIIVPDNVFSGVKGRSYVDNARYHSHSQRQHLFKIDLTAFFPSISREKVFHFFCDELKTSPDVASILTNFTTVDLERIELKDREEIYQFLNQKKVGTLNHLISGAPTSQILSYLVNHTMFDEIQKYCDNNQVVMTIYVDDITFSSEHRISYAFQEKVHSIITKFGYHLSKEKAKRYKKLKAKLVTGVVIKSNGTIRLKNSMRQKIMIEFHHLQGHPDDLVSRKRLRGLLLAARQVEQNVYPTIYQFAFNQKMHEG